MRSSICCTGLCVTCRLLERCECYLFVDFSSAFNINPIAAQEEDRRKGGPAGWLQEHESDMVVCTTEVLQGAVLSLFLFLLYPPDFDTTVKVPSPEVLQIHPHRCCESEGDEYKYQGLITDFVGVV